MIRCPVTVACVSVIWAATACGAAGFQQTAERVKASEYTVLYDETAGGPVELMLHRWLMSRMDQAEAEIESTAAEITNLDQLHRWQTQVRARFRDALGEFPERTPLNPVITGDIKANGYRVQKILFESRPAHYVTAALFLPDPDRFPPPYPGILIPCGHSAQGKGIDTYQRGGVLAAVNGMAALIYDPIDQGERLQDVDAAGKSRFSGTSGHNKVGVSAILLGWNTASFRVWDGMRALDYLQSRPDIDGDRLGCMGNSGGGTLTAFLTALDDRIKVSSPSCYITSLNMVCRSIGPQDAEQNIFGQMAFGMDHAEFLLLRSPAPVCICSATQDFFPIAGARKAFARTRSVYSRLGFEDRITMVENEGTHGWAETLRVGATRWMNRWLREQDMLEVPALSEMGIPEDQILVTEPGQVMLLPGARSVYDLMRDELHRLEAVRKASPRDLRAAVRRRAGIHSLDQLPEPTVIERGEVVQEWGVIRRQAFQNANGLLLPSLMFLPKQMTGQPILLAHGAGKAAAVDDATALAMQGRLVLAVDLTGFGELQGAAKPFYGSPTKDEPDAVVAYLLGRSLTGMRAEDLLLTGRWLAEEFHGPLDLHAAGWAVTPALHAAVAELELFGNVVLTDRPPTWNQVVTEGARHRYSDVVHGALQEYDLTELESSLRSVAVRDRGTEK